MVEVGSHWSRVMVLVDICETVLNSGASSLLVLHGHASTWTLICLGVNIKPTFSLAPTRSFFFNAPPPDVGALSVGLLCPVESASSPGC